MICKNCGGVLDEGAKFCRFCGSPAEERPIPPEGGAPRPASDKKTAVRRALCSVFAVLTLLSLNMSWLKIHIELPSVDALSGMAADGGGPGIDLSLSVLKLTDLICRSNELVARAAETMTDVYGPAGQGVIDARELNGAMGIVVLFLCFVSALIAIAIVCLGCFLCLGDLLPRASAVLGQAGGALAFTASGIFGSVAFIVGRAVEEAGGGSAASLGNTPFVFAALICGAAEVILITALKKFWLRSERRE